MKTTTSNFILDFIRAHEQTTIKNLVDYFGFSSQAIHRQIKKLLEQKDIVKVGSAPKVYYKLYLENKIPLKKQPKNKPTVEHKISLEEKLLMLKKTIK
jgi:DeoR/GlpR family transcriptional regulator of sugar metabolism